ncbi:sugar ABC transporter periplasmic ligand binding protein [Aeromonas diversa CDC 2478-85]|uniref:Sugar ABC transporter periplasmic ligand binding protein n=2 Tax=Aeromonas TaxID=642 RepID=N9VR01_9GAMM|nr:sugar ABC transporter substrate-binding protein [Aeromonas diversa]ENY73731.1 sugar ABC transporter periplasmic ligand binding protein [Aeromonas diversa CDC 2478-85]
MIKRWHRVLFWGMVTLTAWGAWGAPSVGMVLKSVRNEFFVEMAKGAEAYAAAHPDDLTLIVEGIQQEVDVTGQEAIIRRMIAQKVNALIVVPTDSVAMLPVLMEAIRAGILVINMDNKLDDRALVLEGVNIPFVGPSNFAGARSVGEQVAKALPPGSKVGLIEGPPGAINSRARSDGFRAALRAAGMLVAGIRSGYWDTEQGYAASLDLLRAVPEVKALLCSNDNMAIGAARAVAELGLQGKVLIGGYDHIPGVQPYIDDGRVLATADQYPGKQAQYALDLALKALAGKMAQADLPGIVQTPVELVTHR